MKATAVNVDWFDAPGTSKQTILRDSGTEMLAGTNVI
jgi:hypothetical protein